MKYNLGKKPRAHDKRIPSLSALFELSNLPALPPELDQTVGMPANFGMMENDELGDCTCAAYYHARQVWTFHAASKEITEDDYHVEALYQLACGYVPGHPDTDKGGVEQEVLNFLLNIGAPTGANAVTRTKILAYFEIHAGRLDDVRRTIYECGAAYVGVQLPQSVINQLDARDAAVDGNDDASAFNDALQRQKDHCALMDDLHPFKANLMKEQYKEILPIPAIVWDVGGDESIAGGHAIALVGYDAEGFTCISWGQKFKITNAFMQKFLEEAYAIIDPAWVASSGKTPLNMTPEILETQMKELRG